MLSARIRKGVAIKYVDKIKNVSELLLKIVMVDFGGVTKIKDDFWLLG